MRKWWLQAAGEKILAWWHCERCAQQGEREGLCVWQEGAVLRIEDFKQHQRRVVWLFSAKEECVWLLAGCCKGLPGLQSRICHSWMLTG